MDYKELAADVLSGCDENCVACKYAGDNEVECTIAQAAATAITKLLARAEAAEALLRFWASRCKETTLRAEEAERFASNLCDLCDDFTDYVTSGVPNAAPYCANQCPECVNGRGWCTWGTACRGFAPKAAKRQEADEHGKV